MFGSARTAPDDPIYVLARDLARQLATEGWMIVTGAGPGIMAAGTEGAGRDLSFGVNIRLPHEQGANAFIAQDPKLVEMRYFFTRKLMLIKESHAYVVLPGGFGTLDECFELLTLLQTGQGRARPGRPRRDAGRAGSGARGCGSWRKRSSRAATSRCRTSGSSGS